MIDLPQTPETSLIKPLVQSNAPLPLAPEQPLHPLPLAVAIATLLAACGGGDSGADRSATTRLGSEAEGAPYKPLPGGNPEQSGPQPRRQALARLPTPGELVNWVEKKFPSFFPGSETTRYNGDIIFRYCAASGNIFAILCQGVYVLGPITEHRVVNVGTLADFAQAVSAELAGVAVNSDAGRSAFCCKRNSPHPCLKLPRWARRAMPPGWMNSRPGL